MAWGNNDYGQSNVPEWLSGVTAVAAGVYHSLALRNDGTVVAWGCGWYADPLICAVPEGLSDVTAISAGMYHSLALRSDGTVVGWGVDIGQVSVPLDLTGVTAIAASSAHSLAVYDDGLVMAWGCPGGWDHGQCTVPADLNSVVAIATSPGHSLALKGDGTVVAWGCQGGYEFGQCAVPADLSGVVAIAAGAGHSLALKGDGTVVAWGCQGGFYAGQCDVPYDLSGVTAIAAGPWDSLAIRGDGTVTAWGCQFGNDFGQCAVPADLGGAVAIAAGDLHSLAVRAPAADLQVSQSSTPTPAFVGQPLSYNLTVTNIGDLAAEDVLLTDVLPAGVTLLSVPAGCLEAAGTMTCALGTLAAGTSVELTLVVSPLAKGPLSNTVIAAMATPDSNPANNASTSFTVVFNANALLAVVTANTTATYSRAGTAVVGGSVSCEEPIVLNLDITLQQPIGKKNSVSGSYVTDLSCSPGSPMDWTALIIPTTGKFAGGKAILTVAYDGDANIFVGENPPDTAPYANCYGPWYDWGVGGYMYQCVPDGSVVQGVRMTK